MATEWLVTFLSLVQGADASILHALNTFSGNEVFDRAADFVCSNNLLRGTLPVGVYWYFWFKETPNRASNRVMLMKGIAATIAAILLARGIAHLLPSRVRPFADPASGFVPFLEPNGRGFEDWSSFPSDTAAYEFALAWSLFYVSRGWSIAVLLYTAAFACLPRVYIGVHYPSDVVVGAAIGMLTAACFQMLALPRLARSRVVAGDRTSPLFYLLAFYLTSELGQVFDNLRDARRFWTSLPPLASHHILLAIGGAGLLLAAAGAIAFGRRARRATPNASRRPDEILPARSPALKARAQAETV